jgi:hypothetical protein
MSKVSETNSVEMKELLLRRGKKTGDVMDFFACRRLHHAHPTNPPHTSPLANRSSIARA